MRTPDTEADLDDGTKLGSYNMKFHPGSHMAKSFGTSFDFVENASILGAELSAVFGPFSFQAEYAGTTVNELNLETGKVDAISVPGYYAYVSYFLTGDHRSYKNSYGTFGRTKPAKNFCLKDGNWGGLEVAVRYDALDYSNAYNDGDSFKNYTGITAGLNWYLNSHTRIMYNYTNASSGIKDDASYGIHVGRFQIDF